MALTQRLQLRQSQALVMTPQLLQAIKLLQLSNLDLVAYVEAELERNPLLERNDEGEAESPREAVDGGGEAGAAAETSERDSAERDGQDDWISTELETDAGEISAKLDADLGNVFPDETPRAPDQLPPALDRWSQTSSREVSGVDDRTLEAF